MAREHRNSVTISSQIQNKINKILNNYRHHEYLSPIDVLNSRRTSYRQGNKNQINKKANADYIKINRLKKKLRKEQDRNINNTNINTDTDTNTIVVVLVLVLFVVVVIVVIALLFFFMMVVDVVFCDCT